MTLFVDLVEYSFRKGRVAFVAQDIGEAMLHVGGGSPADTVLLDENGPLRGVFRGKDQRTRGASRQAVDAIEQTQERGHFEALVIRHVDIVHP